jgi:hypothetical protein
MWKKRRNNKEKIPTPASTPKTPATALPSVVVVVVVSVVVVEVSAAGVLICIVESDFREACYEKVWRRKSIPY